MTDLSKLRSLQEQASPGPWHVGGKGEMVLNSTGHPVLHASEFRNGFLETAKLAALVPHLLPIAEVVHCSHDHNAGTEECLESDACTVPCPQCKALKDLMEALE